MRKLAEESQSAAKQIATLVTEIRSDTDLAVDAMRDGTNEARLGTAVVTEAGKAFDEIFNMIADLSVQVREISVAIEGIAEGSGEIVRAVREIDTISRTTAEQSRSVSATGVDQSTMMSEIAASSQVLAKMAEDLASTVGRFKV